MSELTIVRHCSPTLAGLKAGNLFSYPYKTLPALMTEIAKVNRLINGRGVFIKLLRHSEHRALIYVFRPVHLARNWQQPETQQLLNRFDYDGSDLPACLDKLEKRLASASTFPHEIGLFLGYPPVDVKGFMEQGPRACLFEGCWKVYGDVPQAKVLFSQYKKCTQVYCRRCAAGDSLTRLTVPV